MPDASGNQVLLSLSRLNRVRAIDAANLTITVDAGCVLQAVQEAAAARDLLFPLSLGSEGSCSIGGNLATNAGGTQVLRYGNARELCLGLEVVTAAGEVWDGLTGLRKDNTGYDLRDLLIGSEGTLGIITAATLKLFPRPAAVTTALAATPTLQAAVELLQLAQARLGPALTGFEAMNEFALGLVRKHFAALRQPLRTGALDGADRAVGRREHRARRDPVRGAAGERREARPRHRCGDRLEPRAVALDVASARVDHPGAGGRGANIKHDISLPVSAIAGFVAETDAALRRAFPGIRIVDFGHLGDGNLHYNIQAPGGHAAGRLPRALRACDQPPGVRRRGRPRRLVLGRTRHRHAQARCPGRTQVAGGARDDALDQAGARPARAC